MKYQVLDQSGKNSGETLLPKEIFEVPFNSDLVHQVVVSQMANRRKALAQTKDRSQVKGGGRKPWRQKGTGRARHGSIRSPIWIGGGVTFGPTKERVFKKKINSKVKRKALFMALSAKAKNDLLQVVDSLNLAEAKTKLMQKVLKDLKVKDSVLIVLPKADEKITRPAGNLPKVATIEARNLNALDILSFKYLLIQKDALKIIKETFLK